jgi:hypothetical protein
MAQQTAIEKLMQVIDFWNISIDCPNLYKCICEAVTELEKEQIEQAYLVGLDDGFQNKVCAYTKYKDGTEYYNRTYKQ